MRLVSHRTAVLMIVLLVATQFCIESCSPPSQLKKIRDEAEQALDPGPRVWLPRDSKPAPTPEPELRLEIRDVI